MKDIDKQIEEAAKEYVHSEGHYEGHYTYDQIIGFINDSFVDGASFILEKWKETERWRDVNEELPSSKNGYVDYLVLVRCKNKNKEDGIWVYDMCYFDGIAWSERCHTWENIVSWKPIKE